MPLNSFQTSGSSPTVARCRVGLLGFGTVGSAIARRLTAHDAPSNLRLAFICDRRAHEKRARQPEAFNAVTWTSRFDDLLASDVDVIVETISGGEPAFDYVRAALLAGKSVVTSNKQVIAHHGPALLALAERQGRQLRFEAAVGGAMPIVRAIEGLSGDRIVRIEAVLNGTTNAVLSQMESEGCSMDEAIADACARGYAEADPSADLDGADAAAKLSILCAIAFGVRVSPQQIETRTTGRVDLSDFQEARQRGCTLRQIAHAAYDYERGMLVAWVQPVEVSRSSIFARATGPENAAVIVGTHAGEIVVMGSGAGGDATAVAVLSDLAAIARDRAAIVPAPVLIEPQWVAGVGGDKIAEAV